ncbi:MULTISPECIES: DUF6019 family protein [Bacillus]|uniref:DUF6019 family protein n=1 Tax=Bacillus TaxID=1386 RepID=UPI000BB79BA6|nr:MULTISPECIES: DUF6019 family protein [Bacillus]
MDLIPILSCMFLFFLTLYFVIKAAVKNGMNESKELRKLNIELQDIKKQVKFSHQNEQKHYVNKKI